MAEATPFDEVAVAWRLQPATATNKLAATRARNRRFIRRDSMPGASTEQTALLIGVDGGGTFTDLVAFDPATAKLSVLKLPSTPPDFHRAVIEAATRACAAGDRPARLVHGSTVATNALLQRAGEPVAFVTTEGFRDMLLIGRQNRPDLLDG